MATHKPNLIEASMKFYQVTIVITLLLMGAGAWALISMPRRESPRITVRQGLVVALYPGADELQVEQQVTKKLEQYLFGFEEVRKEKTYSTTQDGQVVINVELQEWVKDSKRFWASLQHGLNEFKVNLPVGVQGPFVNSDFGDVSAVLLTVSSSRQSYAQLKAYLDRLEDAIKTIPAASKIRSSGQQREQLYITVDNQKLKQYPLDFTRIAQVLQAQNQVQYAGELTVAQTNVPVTTKGEFRSEQELANQIVYANPGGAVVRLRDVARIERRYEEPTSYIRIGQDRVLLLSVEMQPGNNIVWFGRDLDKKIEQVKAQLPPDVTITKVVSQPQVVAHSIQHFMTEFAVAIGAVIVVVMLLLPFRMAAISALASPISILVTFAILNMLGVELHEVTLAALIVVLGMVVDDAIVVVDNYVEKLDEGLTPWEAGWKSATQLVVPIFSATATIMFAFLPLGFMLNGLTGEFIAAMPVTVAIALFSSFVVAMLLTPYFCYRFIKRGLHQQQARPDGKPPKPSVLDRVQEVFNRAVEACLRQPRTTLLAGGISVVLGAVALSATKTQLFPESERDQFNLEVWLPEGTALSRTEAAVRRIEAAVQGDKRIVKTISFVGTSSPRFHSSYAPEIPRRNFAQIFVNTTSNEATKELIKEYLHKFDGFLPDGYIRVRPLSNQETQAPVEVRIVSENVRDLKRMGEQVAGILRQTEGTNWVRTDYENDYIGATVNVREDVANQLGLSRSAIAQTLGAGLKGLPISTYWEGDKALDILLRLDATDRSDFDDLKQVYISNPEGVKIPLLQVATVEPGWHTGKLVRRNGLRTLTVRSEAQRDLLASEVLAIARPQIDALALPAGVQIQYGGDEESTLETAPGMLLSLAVSTVLIFLTLLLQFKSFGKSLIILATFPLSLLGAGLGLLMTGNPLGFTAFLGIISLIGIVVRNGIILVDYADELSRDRGYTPQQAALAAAQRRMRPIFLTSSAAAIGVVPMIIGQSPLWAPLGSVLAVGLLVSMVMTLFVVPVLYAQFIKPAVTPKPEPLPVAQVTQP